MTTKYDVAISFAEEDRKIAEQMALALVQRNVRVFYDKFEQAELWGKDLAEHLSWIYSQGTKFFMPLISKTYAEKSGYARLEKQSGIAHQLTTSTDYILPVRIDETPLSGLPVTTCYLKFSEYGPAKIADMVLTKLGVPSNNSPFNSGIKESADSRATPAGATSATELVSDPRIKQHIQFANSLFSSRQTSPFFSMISIASPTVQISQERIAKTFLDLSKRYSAELNNSENSKVHPAGYTRVYEVARVQPPETIYATTCRFDGLIVTEGDLRSLDFYQEGMFNPLWFAYEIQRHLQLSREILEGFTDDLWLLVILQNLENISWEIYAGHRVSKRMPYVGYHDNISKKVGLNDIYGRERWNDCMPTVMDVMLVVARIFGMDQLPNSYWDQDGKMLYAKGFAER